MAMDDNYSSEKSWGWGVYLFNLNLKYLIKTLNKGLDILIMI